MVIERESQNVFSYLSYNLLDIIRRSEEDFTWDNANGIGFTWRGYNGTQSREKLQMARKLDGLKQGLFDIFINTSVIREGESEFKYGHEGATHRDILQDLLNRGLLDEARLVWGGAFPDEVTNVTEEVETLSVLSLMMFEQEVNWGGTTTSGGKRRMRNSWQRNTPHFYPFQGSRALERRPRDLLMGYIEWAFEENSLENLEFWIESRGSITLSPSNPTDRYETSSRLMEYRDGFGAQGGAPVMSGELLEEYQCVAEDSPNNPHLDEG